MSLPCLFPPPNSGTSLSNLFFYSKLIGDGDFLMSYANSPSSDYVFSFWSFFDYIDIDLAIPLFYFFITNG